MLKVLREYAEDQKAANCIVNNTLKKCLMIKNRWTVIIFSIDLFRCIESQVGATPVHVSPIFTRISDILLDMTLL